LETIASSDIENLQISFKQSSIAIPLCETYQTKIIFPKSSTAFFQSLQVCAIQLVACDAIWQPVMKIGSL
jgi:hypothetical protein